MSDQHQLERAIAAQEALRGIVPDEVVDSAVAALRRQLATLDAAAPRRRQVTVLFADVSGFTAMSEQMDAELVSGMMNDIWRRLDVVVTSHGGRIDKHIGDALMAVWGADGTREDDPERAVRAGLALQERLAAFAAESGIDVAMRVGISTGPGHLGAMGTTAESTVMGDTVNVASRLEHLAPVHGVLISHETYRTVRGVFDVQPLGEVEVRGKRGTVRVYRVERAKPRAFRLPTRGVEGVETRTIGRDEEMRVLRESLTQVVDGAGARLVTVIADAGAGKSRLLYEFLNWAELMPSRVYLFTGRALRQPPERCARALSGRGGDAVRHPRQRSGGCGADEAARRFRRSPLAGRGRRRGALAGVRAVVEPCGAAAARCAVRDHRTRSAGGLLRLARRERARRARPRGLALG